MVKRRASAARYQDIILVSCPKPGNNDYGWNVVTVSWRVFLYQMWNVIFNSCMLYTWVQAAVRVVFLKSKRLYIASESVKWQITLENSLVVVSYKVKHTLPMQSSNPTPWYLPKRNKNLYPHKDLHLSTPSSVIMITKSGNNPNIH